MTFFLIDYLIVSTLLLMIARLGWTWFGQPTRRLVLARIVLLLLFASAVVLLVPDRPCISLRVQNECRVQNESQERFNTYSELRPLSSELSTRSGIRSQGMMEMMATPIRVSLDLPREENAPVSSQFGDTSVGFVPPVMSTMPTEISPTTEILETTEQAVSEPVVSEQWWFRFDPVAWMLGAYFCGMLLVGLWLAFGAIHLRRLLRHSQNIPEDMQELCDLCVSARNKTTSGKNTTRVRISPKIAAPIVSGVLRPTILLPESFWKEKRKACDQGLRFAVAHEWAHIVNGDLWFLALYRLLTLVLFPHPLFWWLGRRMREEQELLADAHAAAMTLGQLGQAGQDVRDEKPHEGKTHDERENRRRYALELVRWSRRAKTAPAAIHAASLTLAIGEEISRKDTKRNRHNTSFTRRIDMLLDENQLELNTPRRWKFFATLLLGTAMLTFSLVTLQPRQIVVADETTIEITADENEIKAGMERSAMTGSTQQPSPQFSRQHIQELLEESFACTFGTEVPLRTVLDRIQEKIAFPILITNEAHAALGFPQEITVHAQLPFLMPLKNVLDYLVKQHDLAWHVRDGEMILITDKSYSGEYLYKAYYVGDLTAYPASPDKDLYASQLSANFDAIATYIRTMVAPESWNEEMITIRPYSDTLTLIIRQTEANHQQIGELLRNLRKTNDIQLQITYNALTEDGTDYSRGSMTFLNGYEYPLPPDWRGDRLGEYTIVIAPISSKPVHDIFARLNEPIQVRWPEGKFITIWGVAGKRGNQDTIKLTVTVEGEEPVTRVFYASPIIQEEVELPQEQPSNVSSLNSRFFVETKTVGKSYNVEDILVGLAENGDKQGEELIFLIKTVITPMDWEDFAKIERDGTNLVVTHYPSGHEQIEDLLRQLRTLGPENTYQSPAIPLDTYRLGPGDTLGIYIESLTGTPGQPIPTHRPDPGTNLPPTTGYPFTVRDDGTIALPKMLHSLNVEGLTLMETQSLIFRAYVEVLQILGQDAVITVSLIRPRVVRAFSITVPQGSTEKK